MEDPRPLIKVCELRQWGGRQYLAFPMGYGENRTLTTWHDPRLTGHRWSQYSADSRVALDYFLLSPEEWV